MRTLGVPQLARRTLAAPLVLVLALAAACGEASVPEPSPYTGAEATAVASGCVARFDCPGDAEELAAEAAAVGLAAAWRLGTESYAPFYSDLHPRYAHDPEGAEPTPVPGRPSSDGWRAVSSHQHSAPGGETPWASGVKHIIADGDSKGFDFALITDHNTIGAWFIKEFVTQGRTTPLRGEEWTSKLGHATLFDFSATTAADVFNPCDHNGATCADAESERQTLVRQVHARGGLVIINHPVLATYAWPGTLAGADGAEIGPTISNLPANESIDWWVRQIEAWLAEDLRGVASPQPLLTAWGGSDYHYLRPKPAPEEDAPCNLLYAPEGTIASIKEAVRARHNQVIYEAHGPQVFLGVDLGGGGEFNDFMAGDFVAAPVGTAFDLQVRIIGGKGDELSLIETTLVQSETETIARQVRIIERPVTSDDWVYRLRRTRQAHSRSFIRAQLGTSLLVRRPKTVTNPVYF